MNEPVTRFPGAFRGYGIFLALAVAISAVCFAGFSFTYFGPLVTGSYPPAGTPLHVHGWSYFLWYLLLPLQAVLIVLGKGRVHRMIGRASPLLVVAMTLTGVLVLTVRVEEAVRTGGDPVWLLYGPLILSNLVLFVFFYGFSLRMAIRGDLAAHIRLLLVGSAIGVGAAFFRLVLFLSGFHPLSLPIGVLACSLFIGMGLAHDRLVVGRVHWAYWVGLAAMMLVEVPLLPQVNPKGVEVGTSILAEVGEHLRVFYETEPTVQFSDE